MISTAAGYEIVDVDGLERFISGGIMPVRQEGAKRALKYEDYLFLLEGRLERENWRTRYAGEKRKPAGRRLRRGAAEEATRIELTNESNFIDNTITLPATAVTVADASRWWGQVEVEPQLEEVQFGKVLKKDPIEAAYRNLERLTRTHDGVGTDQMYGSGASYIWHNKGVNIHGEPFESHPRLDGVYALYYFHAGRNGATAWESTYVEQEFGTGRRTKEYPYAKSGKLLLHISIIHETDDAYETFEDIVPVDLAANEGVAGSYFDLGEVDLVSLAKAALSRHGIGVHGGPANDDFEETWVNYDGSTLIIENEFPATPPAAAQGGQQQ